MRPPRVTLRGGQEKEEEEEGEEEEEKGEKKKEEGEEEEELATETNGIHWLCRQVYILKAPWAG